MNGGFIVTMKTSSGDGNQSMSTPGVRFDALLDVGRNRGLVA